MNVKYSVQEQLYGDETYYYSSNHCILHFYHLPKEFTLHLFTDVMFTYFGDSLYFRPGRNDEGKDVEIYKIKDLHDIEVYVHDGVMDIKLNDIAFMSKLYPQNKELRVSINKDIMMDYNHVE